VGAANARRCLDALGLGAVPVGIGRASAKEPPAWRERSEALGWAQLSPASTAQTYLNAVDLLGDSIEKAETSVGVISLGPLTDVADLLERRPDMRSRIAFVLYYGTLPGSPFPGTNSLWDPEAVSKVLDSSVSVAVVSESTGAAMAFDEPLLESVRSLNSAAARSIASSHADGRVLKLVREGHLRIWDEKLPLYLSDMSLGRFQKTVERPWVSTLSAWDDSRARDAYLRLLRDSVLQPREGVVLSFFPADPGMLREDVQPVVSDLISRHGLEEWKAALLTNELHRHLGTYSIVGAKMGIRAREILGAGLDELEVESLAGLKPPLSCLNDGLQAATGASLGRGTIRVDEGSYSAAAVFRKGEKWVKLTLKPEIRERIEAEQAEILKTAGGLSATYFSGVRRVSLKHWLELGRDRIFDETILP